MFSVSFPDAGHAAREGLRHFSLASPLPPSTLQPVPCIATVPSPPYPPPRTPPPAHAQEEPSVISDPWPQRVADVGQATREGRGPRA